MKKLLTAPLLLLSLGLGVPALADEAPQPASVQAEAKQADDKILCRRLTPTGSNRAKKVCKPASAWEVIGENGRTSANKLVDRASMATSPLK